MIFRTGRFINHNPVSGYIGDNADNKGIWDINEQKILSVNNKITPPIELINSVLGTGAETNVQRVVFPAHQAGDWLFAIIGSQSITPATPPSGWTSAVSAGQFDTRSTNLMYIVSDGTISTVDFPMVGASGLLYSAGMILRNVGGIGDTNTRLISGVSTSQAYPGLTMQRNDNTSRVIVGYFFQSAIDNNASNISPENIINVGNTHIMGITSTAVSSFDFSPFVTVATGARVTVSAEILKA
jgi:hypothetical protein